MLYNNLRWFFQCVKSLFWEEKKSPSSSCVSPLLLHYHHSHNTTYTSGYQMYVFFPYLEIFCDTSWVSYSLILTLSTWRVCQIPLVKGSVPGDYSLFQKPITSGRSPGYPQLLSSLALHWRFLWHPPPFLGSNHLLEQLTKLKVTLMFTSLLHNKGCHKGYRWTAKIRDS